MYNNYKHKCHRVRLASTATARRRLHNNQSTGRLHTGTRKIHPTSTARGTGQLRIATPAEHVDDTQHTCEKPRKTKTATHNGRQTHLTRRRKLIKRSSPLLFDTWRPHSTDRHSHPREPSRPMFYTKRTKRNLSPVVAYTARHESGTKGVGFSNTRHVRWPYNTNGHHKYAHAPREPSRAAVAKRQHTIAGPLLRHRFKKLSATLDDSGNMMGHEAVPPTITAGGGGKPDRVRTSSPCELCSHRTGEPDYPGDQHGRLDGVRS